MSFPRTRLMRSFSALLFLLMLTTLTLARDYVVPDEPLVVIYEGVEQAGQVALSVDGRFVAVSSIVDGHVYVHDRQSSTTERVSVDSQGEPLTTVYGGLALSISDDGRYVAFPIFANEDYDGDIYLHDRLMGNTKSIGKDEQGQQLSWLDTAGTVMTGDGRYVAYWGGVTLPCENDGGCASIYLYDQQTQKTELISINDQGIRADNANGFPAISDNGRYVAFLSDATNLGGPNLLCDEIEGHRFNCSHLYLHDRQQHTTQYIPLPNNWEEVQLLVSGVLFGLNMSGNGRYIVYTYLIEGVNDLPYVTYVYDTLTETTQIIGLDNPDGGAFPLGLKMISDDGRFLVLGTNDDQLVYLYDNVTDTSTLLKTSSGQPFEPKPFFGPFVPTGLSMSGDGSTIVFFIDHSFPTPNGTIYLAHDQPFSPAPYTEVELVKNGGAETQGVMTKMAEDWQVTDTRAGRRRCDHFPHTDSCVFQIKPVIGKIARFTQSVPAVNNPGDVLKFSAFVRGNNVKRATIRVLVNYADGTSEFVKIPSAQLNGTYDYKQVTAMMTLDKLASSIKVQMYIHYRGTGKLLVDDVSLMLGSGAPTLIEIPPMPNTPTPDGSLLPGRITH